MAGRHANPVEKSFQKLQQAWELGFTKKEIVSALGISGMWYDRCADEVKGLSHKHLALLDALIKTGKPSQPGLPIKYEQPVHIPGTKFDFTVFKRINEE